METKLEQYKRMTTKEDVAPSGMTFRWRGATSLEVGNALRAMPSFNGPESSTTKRVDLRRDLEQGEAYSKALIPACVLEPRVVVLDDGMELPEDAIPFSALTNEDVNWLVGRIIGAAKLGGPEAEAAGRVLPAR